MIPVHSSWLSAHGKLWYDDKWYRLAWIVFPQALALLAMLWFWATPTASKNAQWAKPVDPAQRVSQLLALRDAAKTSKVAMDTLERDARGGEMVAEFFYGTLFDPDFKLSTIVQHPEPMTGTAGLPPRATNPRSTILRSPSIRESSPCGPYQSLLLCPQTRNRFLSRWTSCQGRLLRPRSWRHAHRHGAGRQCL
jgi:hypothetical protein